MSAVLDCSFVSGSIVPSQRIEEAVRNMERLISNRTDVISPYLLQIEFASSLRRLRYRGLISELARASAWAELAGLSKAYDCLYLACAEANGAELYTCDGRFFRASEALYPGGIRLIGAAAHELREPFVRPLATRLVAR